MAIVLIAAATIVTGCNKPENNNSNNVKVTTHTPEYVTGVSATTVECGADVIVPQGVNIIEVGVCWGPERNPTIDDEYMSDDFPVNGGAIHVGFIIDFTPATNYHIRAFAVLGAELYYGEDKFISVPGIDLTSALIGIFSVSDTQQVCFSKGNLQYRASTDYWRFAEHQWDCIGYSNSHISDSYDDWIDLFGWATSGYQHGSICYQPWSTSTNGHDYSAYGCQHCDLHDWFDYADWGYNIIKNGGNMENLGWRTLSKEEWNYVFFSRNTISGIRFAKSQVNEVNGIVLLPDNWVESCFELEEVNQRNASFNSNKISSEQWMDLEQQGAVFLPAAGLRDGVSVGDVNSKGHYWSSTCNCVLYFFDDNFYISSSTYKYEGKSVRLVFPNDSLK
jgi:hypothetical protein